MLKYINYIKYILYIHINYDINYSNFQINFTQNNNNLYSIGVLYILL